MLKIFTLYCIVMKNYTLCLFLLFHTFAGMAPKADLIAQTSYNDKRGSARILQYHPGVNEFV